MSPLRRALPWLLGFAIVASVLLAGERVAERGRFSSPYSSYGAGPDGTRALFRLAQELGHDVRPLSRELSHLGPGTLVAIGGCRGAFTRPLARPERETLARWVEAGGLLIVAGVEGYLPAETGLKQERPATCRGPDEQGWLDKMFDGTAPPGERVPFEVEVEPAGPPLAHLEPFTTERANTVRVTPDNEATEILRTELGALGLTAAHGRGRVVLLGIPEALTNAQVSDGGGVVFARLLATFAPKGPVWFDEYHLGMGERRSLVRYLRDLGYGPLLVQLVLVLLVALAAGAVRVGAPREEARPPSPTTRRYLAALGALYAASGDQTGALRVLSRRALRSIARHHRATSVPLDELPRWLAQAGLGAVAEYARRIAESAERPLARGESLLGRAQDIERDATAANVLGDAP